MAKQDVINDDMRAAATATLEITMSEPLRPEDYAQRDEPCCPHCQADSQHLSYRGLDCEGHLVTQQVLCLACDAQWYDLYRLEGYSNLIPGEEQAHAGDAL
jgi:hypothetical protein